jgi:hypothetical protein
MVGYAMLLAMQDTMALCEDGGGVVVASPPSALAVLMAGQGLNAIGRAWRVAPGRQREAVLSTAKSVTSIQMKTNEKAGM